jgi:hypothetical protein
MKTKQRNSGILIWNAKKSDLNKFFMSKVSDFPFFLQRIYHVCFVIRSWINTKCFVFQCQEENFYYSKLRKTKYTKILRRPICLYVSFCLFVCLFFYYLLSLYVVTRHVNGEWRYSAFGKSLCTYKRCWKWCPRASIQGLTRLILFANTFCRSGRHSLGTSRAVTFISLCNKRTVAHYALSSSSVVSNWNVVTSLRKGSTPCWNGRPSV